MSLAQRKETYPEEWQHAIGELTFDFESADPFAKLCDPAYLLQRVRGGLLEAIEKACDAAAQDVELPLAISELEIELDGYPADPDWEAVAQDLAEQVRSALLARAEAAQSRTSVKPKGVEPPASVKDVPTAGPLRSESSSRRPSDEARRPRPANQDAASAKPEAQSKERGQDTLARADMASTERLADASIRPGRDVARHPEGATRPDGVDGSQNFGDEFETEPDRVEPPVGEVPQLTGNKAQEDASKALDAIDAPLEKGRVSPPDGFGQSIAEEDIPEDPSARAQTHIGDTEPAPETDPDPVGAKGSSTEIGQGSPDAPKQNLAPDKTTPHTEDWPKTSSPAQTGVEERRDEDEPEQQNTQKASKPREPDTTHLSQTANSDREPVATETVSPTDGATLQDTREDETKQGSPAGGPNDGKKATHPQPAYPPEAVSTSATGQRAEDTEPLTSHPEEHLYSAASGSEQAHRSGDNRATGADPASAIESKKQRQALDAARDKASNANESQSGTTTSEDFEPARHSPNDSLKAHEDGPFAQSNDQAVPPRSETTQSQPGDNEGPQGPELDVTLRATPVQQEPERPNNNLFPSVWELVRAVAIHGASAPISLRAATRLSKLLDAAHHGADRARSADDTTHAYRAEVERAEPVASVTDAPEIGTIPRGIGDSAPQDPPPPAGIAYTPKAAKSPHPDNEHAARATARSDDQSQAKPGSVEQNAKPIDGSERETAPRARAESGPEATDAENRTSHQALNPEGSQAPDRDVDNATRPDEELRETSGRAERHTPDPLVTQTQNRSAPFSVEEHAESSPGKDTAIDPDTETTIGQRKSISEAPAREPSASGDPVNTSDIEGSPSNSDEKAGATASGEAPSQPQIESSGEQQDLSSLLQHPAQAADQEPLPPAPAPDKPTAHPIPTQSESGAHSDFAEENSSQQQTHVDNTLSETQRSGADRTRPSQTNPGQTSEAAPSSAQDPTASNPTAVLAPGTSDPESDASAPLDATKANATEVDSQSEAPRSPRAQVAQDDRASGSDTLQAGGSQALAGADTAKDHDESTNSPSASNDHNDELKPSSDVGEDRAFSPNTESPSVPRQSSTDENARGISAPQAVETSLQNGNANLDRAPDVMKPDQQPHGSALQRAAAAQRANATPNPNVQNSGDGDRYAPPHNPPGEATTSFPTSPALAEGTQTHPTLRNATQDATTILREAWRARPETILASLEGLGVPELLALLRSLLAHVPNRKRLGREANGETAPQIPSPSEGAPETPSSLNPDPGTEKRQHVEPEGVGQNRPGEELTKDPTERELPRSNPRRLGRSPESSDTEHPAENQAKAGSQGKDTLGDAKQLNAGPELHRHGGPKQAATPPTPTTGSDQSGPAGRTDAQKRKKPKNESTNAPLDRATHKQNAGRATKSTHQKLPLPSPERPNATQTASPLLTAAEEATRRSHAPSRLLRSILHAVALDQPVDLAAIAERAKAQSGPVPTAPIPYPAKREPGRFDPPPDELNAERLDQNRRPSGSDANARTSQPDSFDPTRNSAQHSDHFPAGTNPSGLARRGRPDDSASDDKPAVSRAHRPDASHADHPVQGTSEAAAASEELDWTNPNEIAAFLSSPALAEARAAQIVAALAPDALRRLIAAQRPSFATRDLVALEILWSALLPEPDTEARSAAGMWQFALCLAFAPAPLPGGVAGLARAAVSHLAPSPEERRALVAALSDTLGSMRPAHAPAAPALLLSGLSTLPGATLPIASEQDAREFSPDVTRSAGLVLLTPYLPMLFSRLGLLEKQAFASIEARQTALDALQTLVWGDASPTADTQSLERLLCAVPADLALPPAAPLREPGQLERIDGLLRAVIGQWPALGSTSPDGLRGSFLQREGLLSLVDQGHRLEVSPRAFDMLIDRLPWSYALVKLPWMTGPIHVKWRES